MKKPVFRTDEEWFDIIAACRKSGMTDERWCQQNGISTSSFYRHLKLLRENACDIPAPVERLEPVRQEVVPVEITSLSGELHRLSAPNMPELDAVLRIRSGNISIDVTNEVDESLASAIIAALHVSC